MWAQVQLASAPGGGEAPAGAKESGAAPSSRSKHAMCISQDGCFYLLAGRSANLPLKDLWRFDPVQSRWEEVRCRGSRPPCLQEHTVVSWKGKLYVFGGEVGFASTGETPLWIFDTGSGAWRKHPGGGERQRPTGRRGHTCVVHNGAMHVFGGYQDLRGSSSQLWAFRFDTEQWELTSGEGSSGCGEHPPARHNHSCVVHQGAMWVYGGLTDLQERSDFWTYHFDGGRWSRVRQAKGGPVELHGHAAVQAQGFMYLFGGERAGAANNDLWRFHFASETWEKVAVEGAVPTPRCRHVALVNPGMATWADRVSSREEEECAAALSQHRPRAAGRAASMRFKVHPVSRLCSKRTGSQDEDDDDDGGCAYGGCGAQVNLRSLKEKLSSSRLVRSISSGNYAVGGVRRDETVKLLEGDGAASNAPTPQAIQKSASSDAVLEASDSSGASTPRHQLTVRVRPLSEILPRNRDCSVPVPPGMLSPPPQSNRSRRITSSQSLNTFNVSSSAAASAAARTGASCCCTPTTTTGSDQQHTPCENATDPRADLLIDLDQSSVRYRAGGPRRSTSSYTWFSDASSSGAPASTPLQLSHSTSHCSGYYSFAEEDPELQRDIMNFLTGHGPRSRPTSLNAATAAAIELSTFSAAAQPGIQVVKERARSWDRVSQRTATVCSQAATVAKRAPPIQAIKEESCQSTPVRLRSAGRATHGSPPGGGRPELHQWRLCFYVFGGREQGAPGLYRQPISIWKLYV
ncbi:uncharacterized protein LOC144126030 isoform X1 [Amblyomma americanum]